jgi:lipopolysaccharide biosynthesis protein
MKRLCIFTHFSNENFIPFYVELYLKELSRHFDEVLLVTNERQIKNLNDFQANNPMLVANEGYDFGMFYKGFMQTNHKAYDCIACINDSNILFGKLDFLFDWAKTQACDFWGLYDANVKPKYSTHKDNYHIQSHFLVFNKSAIDELSVFLANTDIAKYYTEKNPKILKQKVINDWEIGLSRYLIAKGLNAKAYVNSERFSIENNIVKDSNLSLKNYQKLIQSGIPLLKKRIIFSTNIKHLLLNSEWKMLISKHGNRDWELEKLIKELSQMRKFHLRQKVKSFLGLK